MPFASKARRAREKAPEVRGRSEGSTQRQPTPNTVWTKLALSSAQPVAAAANLDASHSARGTNGGGSGHVARNPVPPGGGKPLDDTSRSLFESRFGYGFDDVRIHTGPTAERLAGSVGARAYATGHDLVFADGEYSPGTSEGRRLLAHELSHVIQQDLGPGSAAGGTERAEHEADQAGDRLSGSASGPLSAQLSPTSSRLLMKFGDPIFEELGNGITLIGVEGKPSRELKVNGVSWLKLSATAGKIDVTVSFIQLSTGDKREVLRDAVLVEVSSGSWVEGALDVEGEQELLRLNHRSPEFGIRYDFKIHGTISRRYAGAGDLEKYEGPVSRFVIESPKVQPRHSEELTDDFTKTHKEGWFELQMPDSAPTFKDEAALKSFLDSHKDGKFAIIRMPDGGYAARALSNDALRGLAEDARRGDFSKEWLSRFDWYKNKWAEGTLDRFYIGGHEYHKLAQLRDLFFDDDTLAEIGTSGSQQEAEIFRMSPGAATFGRKELSHEAALERWTDLDAMPRENIRALETEPGRPFDFLVVRGSTKVHRLGLEYFTARDVYRKRMEGIAATVDEEEKKRTSSTFDPNVYQDYLSAALDKPTDDPTLIGSFRTQPAIAEKISTRVYTDVETAGQEFAIESFLDVTRVLREQFAGEQSLPTLIFRFPGMQLEQQEQMLHLIGLDEDEVSAWRTTLSKGDNAVNIATGKEIDGVSLALFREKAVKAAEGMEKMVGKLRSREFIALREKGEFGDWVRTAAYKKFGFKLDPKKYPHEDKIPSAGVFTFDPLAGTRSEFVSLAEQMFAAEIRRRAANDEIEKWAKIVGVLVVTLILVVALNAAGAAIAGAAFAEGTLGYFVVQALVVGTGMTVIEMTQRKIEGGELTWGEFFKAEAWNVATAGLLGRLGWQLRGASTAARIGWMGSAFMGAGLTRFLAEKKGKVTAEELAEFMVTNAVMFALMEGVSVITRPLNQSAAAWGRAKRLGILEGEIASLRGDATRLASELTAYAAKPGEAAKDAPALETRMKDVLERQAKLLEQLRTSMRTQADAAELEKAIQGELDAIQNQLAGMRAARFLEDMKIRPVEGSQVNFYYEFAGTPAEAAKRLETFYPGSKAAVEPDGTIQLTLKGDKDPMVLTPKALGKPPTAVVPVGTRKININTATEAELAQLTGIGEALAKKIVAHREANGEFKSVDDLANVEGIGRGKLAQIKTQKLATVATQPPPRPVEPWRAELVDRRQKLLNRADQQGLGLDPALQKLKGLSRIAERTTEASLREAQQIIENAEKVIGGKIEALAKKSFAQVEKRLGANEMKRFRGGALEDIPDAEIGEALARIPSSQLRGRLSVEALRGVVHAHRRRVDLAKFFEAAKGQTPAERNFALEAFAALAEANVGNIEVVLKDMATQSTKWDGGMWMLEFSLKLGAARIASIEVPAEGGGRRYDITLKTGEKYELKNWRDWGGEKVEQLKNEFLFDFGYGETIDPHAWKWHRYVFRGPLPETLPKIRAEMRSWLEEAMIKRGLSRDYRDRMLARFDQEVDLVAESAGFWSGTPAGKITPPVYPLPLVDEDEEKRVPAPVNP